MTASQRAFQMVEALNEGQLVVGRDVQVRSLVGDVAGICNEEFLSGSTFIVSPGVSQRRIEIE